MLDRSLSGPAATTADCLCDEFDSDTSTGAGRIDLRDFADFQGLYAP